MDGQVTQKENKDCADEEHDTNHLVVSYPEAPEMQGCEVPTEYPTTGTYKNNEFADLPVLAKGRTPPECTGMVEISTTPKEGSPEDCECKQVTFNGPYSGGPMVKCTNCLDVRRSLEKNSCPDNTKLFSPRSRRDWETFIKSAKPLKDPSFIVDITSAQRDCGGCSAHAMNSEVNEQRMWKTSDGSPWWLRKDAYTPAAGDTYQVNCYLNILGKVEDQDNIEYSYNGCNYHSKSYYCQRVQFSTTPKAGSPDACSCEKISLRGRYSAGMMLKCTHCLSVRRTTEKNSCPRGMKIFAPASKEDWKTIIASAPPLRDPNWIVDITRPLNGCGGCKDHPMNSKVPHQATWRTADQAAWWLRETRYLEPKANYKANCYLDLGEPESENAITFEANECTYHSKSYYCQPIKKAKLAVEKSSA